VKLESQAVSRPRKPYLALAISGQDVFIESSIKANQQTDGSCEGEYLAAVYILYVEQEEGLTLVMLHERYR
jgi:hypothetical protein